MKKFEQLGANAYIESKSVTKFDWMNRDLFWSADQLSRPFLFALSPAQTDLDIKVPKIPKDKDFCLELKYLITPGSEIAFSVGGSSPLAINELTSAQSQDQKPSSLTLCLRSFVSPQQLDQKLTDVKLKITSKYPQDEDRANSQQIVAIKIDTGKLVEFKTEDVKAKAAKDAFIPTISETPTVQFKDALFPFRIPNSVWSFDKGFIVFKSKLSQFVYVHF